MSVKPVAKRLQWGLFPAVPVPFTSEGKIHEPSQKRYVDYIAGTDAAGVAVWVHTGRGLMLTPQQRDLIISAYRSGLPRDRLIIAGAGPIAQQVRDDSEVPLQKICDEAVAMAEQAKSGGADALLCFPPADLKNRPERQRLLVAYHRRLTEVGLPLILFYLGEAEGGFDYTLDELRDLFSTEGVVGIKMATLEGITTYQAVARMMREDFPEQILISGEDRFLGYSIIMGAKAALIGMGSACTNFQNGLLQAMRRGDAKKFLDLSRRIDALGEAAFCHPIDGYIQRMLWILADAGIVEADATFDPWGPTLNKDAELAFIRRVMKENDIPI